MQQFLNQFIGGVKCALNRDNNLNNFCSFTLSLSAKWLVGIKIMFPYNVNLNLVW